MNKLDKIDAGLSAPDSTQSKAVANISVADITQVLASEIPLESKNLPVAKEFRLFISSKRKGLEEPTLFFEPGLFVVEHDYPVRGTSVA